MAAFQGGRRGTGVNSNRWQQRYQTMRANKLKGDVVERNNSNTGNLERGQRPGAFTMMRNFYQGYSNVSSTCPCVVLSLSLSLSLCPCPCPCPFPCPCPAPVSLCPYSYPCRCVPVPVVVSLY